MLTKHEEELAKIAGKYDFLQTYINIKLNVYRESLERREKEMIEIRKDKESPSQLIMFQQQLIHETIAKIEILEELVIN